MLPDPQGPGRCGTIHSNLEMEADRSLQVDSLGQLSVAVVQFDGEFQIFTFAGLHHRTVAASVSLDTGCAAFFADVPHQNRTGRLPVLVTRGVRQVDLAFFLVVLAEATEPGVRKDWQIGGRIDKRLGIWIRAEKKISCVVSSDRSATDRLLATTKRRQV